jgi:hypothetical protein
MFNSLGWLMVQLFLPKQREAAMCMIAVEWQLGSIA